MPKLSDLIAQRSELDKQIAKVQRDEREQAIAQVKSLMAEHGLTATDLGTRKAKKTSSGGGGKVAAKYRNKATGEAWSGRGLQPRWLKAALATGKKIADFAV
jgi:DNA-binding protein H-NS